MNTFLRSRLRYLFPSFLLLSVLLAFSLFKVGYEQPYFTLDSEVVLEHTVDFATPKPGDAINFTMAYSNEMSETAYNVTVFEWMPSGLTFVSSKPFYDGVSDPETGFYRWSRGTIPPGGSGTVVVKAMVDNVPVGTVITNTAYLSYENGIRVEVTSSVNITVAQAAGVDVYPDQIHSVPPASWSQTEFNLTVTNTGNGLDTFSISLRSVAFNPSASSHDWKIELYNSTGYPSNPVATVYDESQSDPNSWTDHGVLTKVTLAGGKSSWFIIKVTEAQGTSGNEEAYLDVQLTAASLFDSSVSDMVDKMTIVKKKAGIVLGPDYTKYANPGETVVFRHIIVNSYQTEVVDLNYASPKGWSYSFWFDNGTALRDTDGSGYVDVGVLPKEEPVYILVKVTVPYGTAAGVNDTAVITARGVTSGKYDTATDITIVKSTPILKVDKKLVSGNPSYVGEVVTYRINITNLGNTKLTKIPLDDAYETLSLNFSSANPAEDAHDETAGTIHWENLTALEPRQNILVTVDFLATAADDVVRESANVIDAEDEFGNFISATYMNKELKIVGIYTLTVTASPAEALGGTFRVSWTERGVLKNGIFTTPKDVACDQDTTAVVSDPESPITKGDVRYVFAHYSPSAIVEMDSDKTVTLNYRTEYNLTFQQIGSQEPVSITVNGTKWALPQSFWVYESSTTTFSYPSPITDAAGTTRYVLTGVSGNTTDNSVTVNAPTNVTGSYKTQHYLTVNNGGHATPAGEGWYDSGVLATFSIDPTIVPEGVGTRYVFTQWSGDSTSTNPTDTILLNGPKTVTANWKTQYRVTFTQTGSGATVNVTYTADVDPTVEVPFSTWVKAGSTLTFTYDAIVEDGEPTRYVQVSVNQTSPVIVNSPMTITATYKTQHYLTVGHLPIDSILDGHQTGQGYYDADSNATVTADLHVDIVSGASRYMFDHWSGDASGASTTTTVVMSAPKTATANYKTQYYITVTSTHDYPTHSDWVDAGDDFTASVTSPTEVVPNDEQWVCTGFSVDGGAYQEGTTHTFTNVQAAHTIDFAWKLQFWVNFEQTGVPDGVTAHVTVNSVQNTLPYSDWFDKDFIISFAYEDPVPGVIGTRYVLTNTSEESPLMVEAAITVTANYKTQYYVTFAHTGLDSTATGTVVTVGGSSKTFLDLPYSDWFDSGTTYAYSDIVSSSVAAKRFRIDSITGPASPITNSGTVTGEYIPQYKVTFTQSGLDTTATGTVVTVDGVSKTYEDLPFTTAWLDNGTSLAFEYSSIVSSSIPNKQFELVSVSHTSPLSVTAPTTVAGTYGTQCYVTFDQSGIGSDFTGTVVTIDTIEYVRDDLPVSFWWDRDSAHDFAFASPLNVDGKRYAWTSTSGLSSLQSGTLTVTTSGTVAASYKTQYQVTFSQSGVGSDFTGTVVKIDDADYVVIALPTQFWWDENSEHSFAFQSPLVVTPEAKRYVWNTTSGLSTQQSDASFQVTQSGSVTGNYKTQYYITVTSEHDSPTPSAWVDAGKNFTASVTSPTETVLNDHQWVCTGFSIDGGVAQEGTIYTFQNIQAAHTIVFNWKEQFWIQVNSAHDSPTTSQWIDQGGSLIVGVTSPADDDGMGTRYRCTGYTLDSNLPVTDGTTSYDFVNVQSAHVITFNWIDQYRLIVSSAHDFPSPSGTNWYDISTSLTASVTSPADENNGVRYRCTGWSGTGSVPASGSAASVSFTITAPSTITWNWIVQYKLTVASDYDSPDPSVGEHWYDTGIGITASVTSPADQVGGTRYRCTGWSGTGSVPESGTSTSVTFTIGTPSTLTWNWVTQYELVVESDHDTPIPAMGEHWYDEGEAINASVSSPADESDGTRYKCIGWSGTGSVPATGTDTSVGFTITAPSSIEWNWIAQHQLTIDNGGHGVTTPTSGNWYDAGEWITITMGSDTTSNSTGTRYLFASWSGSGLGSYSGSANPCQVQMNSPITETASWKTQYYLTVNSPYGSSGGAGWYDSGSSAYATLDTDTVSGESGIRYVFTQWSEDASGTNYAQSDPITMVAPKTAVAKWKTQYYLTVNSAHGTPSGSGWYDSDSTAYAALDKGIVSGGSGIQYVFTRWSGDAYGEDYIKSDPITMNTPKTANANWKKQYYLTVASSHGTPSGTAWYDDGSIAHAGLDTGQVAGETGIRYLFTQWSGDASGSDFAQSDSITMDAPKTANANWKTQYYLTVTTDPSDLDDPTGEGWYDEGTHASISVNTPTGGDGVSTRYRFQNWTGVGIVNPAATSTTILMDAPKVAKAVFIEQFKLTMSTNLGVVTPDSGWYDVDSVVPIEAFAPEIVEGNGYVWHGWTGTGEGSYSGIDNPATITMHSAITETAQWKITPILTIIISNDTITSGDRIVVYGKALPVSSSVEILVTYVFPNGTQVEHTVYTNDEGDYEDLLILKQGYIYSLFADAGEWVITAHRAGDFNHETAEESAALVIGAPTVAQLHPALLAGIILACALIAYVIIIKKVKNNKNLWWRATVILCCTGLIFGVVSLALNWSFVSGTATIKNTTFQVDVLLYPFGSGLVSITQGLRYVGAIVPSMTDPTWQNVLGSPGPVLSLWLIPVGCSLLLLAGLYKPKNVRQRNLKVAILVISGVFIVASVVQALSFVQGQVGALEGAGIGYGAGVYLAIISGTLTFLSGLFAYREIIVKPIKPKAP